MSTSLWFSTMRRTALSNRSVLARSKCGFGPRVGSEHSGLRPSFSAKTETGAVKFSMRSSAILSWYSTRLAAPGLAPMSADATCASNLILSARIVGSIAQ